MSALTINIKMKSLATKAKGRLAAKLSQKAGGGGGLPNMSSITSKLASSQSSPAVITKKPAPKTVRLPSPVKPKVTNMYLLTDEPLWKKDRFFHYNV